MRASSPRMRLVGRQGWLQKLPLRPSLSLVRFFSLRVVSLLSCFLIPPRLGSDLATPVVHSSFFFFFFAALRFDSTITTRPSKQPIRQIPSQVSLIEYDAATCTRHPTTAARPLHHHTQRMPDGWGTVQAVGPEAPYALLELSRLCRHTLPCLAASGPLPDLASARQHSGLQAVSIDDVWMPL
ncbi:uncharacterized protein BKA78DRAFT_92553 [Phyllosticta capitalensis]|uniref:uncharacterized protein n=1 Tax=Phyllosticta capitalensis TaxID=121624 RepID=UPI0031313219